MLFWTSESALFNWDPLHRAFFCTSWVKSCLYGTRKMGQRNRSFITPSESKETFYMGKMGSRLTKKPLTLKYVINHVHHNEQQNQVHAGFHKQSGVFHFLLISQKPTNNKLFAQRIILKCMVLLTQVFGWWLHPSPLLNYWSKFSTSLFILLQCIEATKCHRWDHSAGLIALPFLTTQCLILQPASLIKFCTGITRNRRQYKMA